MTIFLFLGPGEGAQPRFHVWSANELFLEGTTYLSGGGGAIAPFNGPAEPPNITLRLPFPAGRVFTQITVEWRAVSPTPEDVTFTVRIVGVGDLHVTAPVSTGAGPGVVLTEAIAAHAATALNAEVEVIASGGLSDTPVDIFVRLDHRSA